MFLYTDATRTTVLFLYPSRELLEMEVEGMVNRNRIRRWLSLPAIDAIASGHHQRLWIDRWRAAAGSIESAAVAPDPQNSYLEEFDLHLPREHAYFLGGLAAARALKAEGARFWVDTSRRLLCEVSGVTVYVTSLEEMYILQEIFVDGVYDVSLPSPYAVWDIGMNVGISTLYFAARGAVHVLGYEPIGSTFEMALANLNLNPALRGTISAVQSGIGGADRTEWVDYCREWKGSVGLMGGVSDPVIRRLMFHLPPDFPIGKESLRLEDAVPILRAMRDAYPDVPIVAKIDCEGAEYEIIEALYRSGDLGSLHALLIEWHRDGPAQLQRWLVEAGFTVFSPASKRRPWGWLYAARGEWG